MTSLSAYLQPVWNNLQKYKAQQRLPHALLFVGEGIGKKELSLALAQQLLCQTQNTCGTCHACHLFVSGTHPDFFLITPQEHGQIKIEQIRQLSEALQQTAQQGGYRVVVVEQAHAMNVAAANALLKTLEEPGNNTIIMLLTERVAFLAATLRSRCQIIHVHTEAQTTISNIDDELLKKIKQILVREVTVVVAASSLLDKPADHTLLALQTILLVLLKAKIGFKVEEKIMTLSKQLTFTKIFYCYDEITNLRRQINEKINLNATLLLENAFLTWITI